MNKENKKGSYSLDELMSKHLKGQQEHMPLGDDFNKSLMYKIDQLEEQVEPALAIKAKSLVMPIVLLAIVTIFTFLYFMGAEQLAVIFDFNISFDHALLSGNGFKYMTYSLMALFVFSLLDRFLQIKLKGLGK